MQSEFLFRGTLVEFDHAVGAQTRLAPKGIRTGYTHQLGIYGKVTVEFFDDRHRVVLVNVTGLPNPDGSSVKVIVRIHRAAYTKRGKLVLSKWTKMKRAWNKAGLLLDLPPPLLENDPYLRVRPKKRKSSRYHSGIQGMLEKIAHRDYCLRKNGQPSKWSDKWQGAIDNKTANSIDRDLHGKIKSRWKDSQVSGDRLVELLFKQYPDFKYLQAEWEELKNKEF